MFRSAAFLSAVFVVCTFAQPGTDPEIAKANAEIERLRVLVEAGAAPALELQKAKDALADAQDSAILAKTLYGQDLTQAMANEMTSAAERRFNRRKAAYESARKLVDAGAAALASLDPPREAMELARKECDMADSRAGLVVELAQMAQVEDIYSAGMLMGSSTAVAERFDGDGAFDMAMFAGIESAFERQFGRPLPVSAMGETAVHRALGFDHRGRVDVAVPPDSSEGAWLRLYLTVKRIPFFAFRQAVPGKATGAHIHIGPISTHLANGG